MPILQGDAKISSSLLVKIHTTIVVVSWLIFTSLLVVSAFHTLRFALLVK